MLGIFCLALSIYRALLLVRVIMSFVFMFRGPGWEPPPGLKPVLNFVYTLTDPPVDYLRRFLPPIAAGAIAFDLAFLVLYLAVSLMHGILGCPPLLGRFL